MQYIFHGRVQGVGFRYFTKQLAKKYNIRGSVRNKSDGTVELIVNDDSDNVDEFIKGIKEGNGFMKIERLEKYEYKSNANNFRVKY